VALGPTTADQHCSTYLEVVYGPLIGPTAVLLARNLDRRLFNEPQPVVVSATSLALELGLRSSRTEPLGRRSHLRQAIERLIHVQIASWLAPNHLGLSAIVLPATAQALAKVPELVVASHHRYLPGISPPDAVPRPRRRP
jgi:hypothetical protein